MYVCITREGRPTKPECVGTTEPVTEAAPIFTALGALVDLASQLYAVPAAILGRIRAGITALVTGPHCGPQALCWIKQFHSESCRSAVAQRARRAGGPLRQAACMAASHTGS